MDLDHMNSLGVGLEIEEMSLETDAAMSRLALAYVIKGAALTPDEVFKVTGFQHAAAVGLFAILISRAGNMGEDPVLRYVANRLGLSAGIRAVCSEEPGQGRFSFRFIPAVD